MADKVQTSLPTSLQTSVDAVLRNAPDPFENRPILLHAVKDALIQEWVRMGLPYGITEAAAERLVRAAVGEYEQSK